MIEANVMVIFIKKYFYEKKNLKQAVAISFIKTEKMFRQPFGVHMSVER